MSVPSDELGRVRKKKKILAPIERIVSRKKWVPLIHQYYYKGERRKNPYPLEAMMRLYLLQNLYDLSDEATAAEAIKASLMDAICTSDEMSDGKLDKATLRWKKIDEYLKIHDYIMNADVRALCEVSAATANRILSSFIEERKLSKYREVGHWAYKLMG